MTHTLISWSVRKNTRSRYHYKCYRPWLRWKSLRSNPELWSAPSAWVSACASEEVSNQIIGTRNGDGRALLRGVHIVDALHVEYNISASALAQTPTPTLQQKAIFLAKIALYLFDTESGKCGCMRVHSVGDSCSTPRPRPASTAYHFACDCVKFEIHADIRVALFRAHNNVYYACPHICIYIYIWTMRVRVCVRVSEREPTVAIHFNIREIARISWMLRALTNIDCINYSRNSHIKIIHR